MMQTESPLSRSTGVCNSVSNEIPVLHIYSDKKDAEVY